MGECGRRLKRPQWAGKKEGFREEEALALALNDGKLFFFYRAAGVAGMNPGVLYHYPQPQEQQSAGSH